jgi:hypothetical protein
MDIGKLFSQAWGLYVKDIGPLIVGSLIAGIVPAVAATIVLFGTLGITFAASSIGAGGEVTGLSPAGWTLLALGMALVVIVALLLTAPLYAGLVAGVVRRIREGRQMGYGDAFVGFSYFGPVVGATVLITLIVLAIVAVPVILGVAAAVLEFALLGIVAGLAALAAAVAVVYLSTRWVYVVLVIVDQNEGATGSLGRSGAMVMKTGWWMTFFAVLLVTIVVSVVSGVLSTIPVVGSIASLLLIPFNLAYVVAMYFQSGEERGLVDAALRPASASAPQQPAETNWQSAPGPVAPPAYPPAAPAPPPPSSTQTGSPAPSPVPPSTAGPPPSAPAPPAPPAQSELTPPAPRQEPEQPPPPGA